MDHDLTWAELLCVIAGTALFVFLVKTYGTEDETRKVCQQLGGETFVRNFETVCVKTIPLVTAKETHK